MNSLLLFTDLEQTVKGQTRNFALKWKVHTWFTI